MREIEIMEQKQNFCNTFMDEN